MRRDITNIDDVLQMYMDQMTELAGAISVLAEAAIQHGWFDSNEDLELQATERAAMMKRVAAHRARMDEEAM